jgi:hypothetical protein
VTDTQHHNMIVGYLAKRLTGMAGHNGRSSDAMVAAAVAESVDIPKDRYPHDTSDLARCCEAFDEAPWQLRELMLPILHNYTGHLLAARVDSNQDTSPQ